jgi:hypothetical protein
LNLLREVRRDADSPIAIRLDSSLQDAEFGRLDNVINQLLCYGSAGKSPGEEMFASDEHRVGGVQQERLPIEHLHMHWDERDLETMDRRGRVA